MSSSLPPIHGHPLTTADYSATWMRRRASNVYGRPGFLLRVGGVAFALTMLIFVALARAGRASSHDAAPAAHLDTLVLDSAEHRAASALLDAETALAKVRSARRASAIANDALSPQLRARRDSMVAQSAEIARLLERSDDAPLVASFRALGVSPALSGAPRITQLLDSLNDLDKARSDFGSSEGVDPIFVALTARVGAIGHEIEGIARGRRAELRRSLDSLAPPPLSNATSDTVPLAAKRDLAARAHTAAVSAAEDARRADSVRVAREERAASGVFGVGIATLTLAALVLATVVALAIALVRELRSPRISDIAEAEALSGTRVLVSITAPTEAPERQRRRADREVPPSIEQSSDAYRLLYGQLADATFDLTVVAITGDDPLVTATISANVAAIAARSGRPTLLVDTDFQEQPVAKLTGIAPTPGVADVLAQRIGWAGAISNVLVSRGRAIDVLPSGALSGTLQAVAEEFGAEVERLTRRYETVVVSASTPGQGTIAVAGAAVGDVVICLRLGRSTHAGLAAVMASLESGGARVKGLVLWDRADPVVTDWAPSAAAKLELLS